VSKYRPQIFRFLLASLRDADIADELMQECFLRAHRNLSRFRGDAKIGTWLMRIAINLQKDHWRSRRIQFWRNVQADSSVAEEAYEWTPSRETSPEAQVAAREQVRLVWKAVERMNERQRTVFLLRFVEELKLTEIAGMTGLREATVKAHLFKAVRKLRQELAQALNPSGESSESP
jgi:RNA polymerase sigma-70 factor (ECF subfamily)